MKNLTVFLYVEDNLFFSGLGEKSISRMENKITEIQSKHFILRKLYWFLNVKHTE